MGGNGGTRVRATPSHTHKKKKTLRRLNGGAVHVVWNWDSTVEREREREVEGKDENERERATRPHRYVLRSLMKNWELEQEMGEGELKM